MIHFTKLTAIGATALLVLLALIGCESDADKIREINESERSPAPTATTPPTTTEPPKTRQIISDTATPYRPTPELTETKQPRAVTTTPTATDSKPLEATIDVLDLQEGDCINSTIPEEITIETVVIVPCNEEWQYRVLSTFEIQDGNYPSDIEFDQHAYSNCDRRFTNTLIPTEEGWASALWRDRKVTCLQESFGFSLSDPAKLDRLVAWDFLQNGDCFNDAPETDDFQVELVPCDSSWQYRVLNSFTVDGSVFPSEIELERQAYANCDPRYTLTLFPEEFWADWRVSCLQESFGLSLTDPAKLDRLVSQYSLDPGECFSEAPETDALLVEIVSCTGVWDYRVVNIISLPEDEAFPGDSYIESRADRDCDVGTDFYFYPTYESWAYGDRQILCVSTN